MSRHRLGKLAIWLAAIGAAAAACSVGAPAPSASAPTPGTATPDLPAGFPVGAWTITITADDLLAVDRAKLAEIGMSEAALVDENSGTFTTTFSADGTWTTVMTSDRPVRWPVFSGTFVADGPSEMIQITTFPPDFAGEAVRYTWRVEDGLLYLAVPDPPDPILGVITAAHPWSPAR